MRNGLSSEKNRINVLINGDDIFIILKRFQEVLKKLPEKLKNPYFENAYGSDNLAILPPSTT